MMRLLPLVFLLGMVQSAMAVTPLFSDSLRHTADSLLGQAGLDWAETGFVKAWVEDDTFKLPLIDSALHRPLLLTEIGDSLISGDIGFPNLEHLLTLTPWLLNQPHALKQKTNTVVQEIPLFPPGLGLTEFYQEVVQSEHCLQYFLQPLNEKERSIILYHALDFWAEGDDRDLKGAISCEQDLGDTLVTGSSAEELFTFAADLEFAWLREALSHSRRAMEYLNTDPRAYSELVLPQLIATPLGDIVLANITDDIHTQRDFLLLIDPGGNDTYLHGIPAAQPKQPLQYVLDLTGNDLYRTEADTGPAQGSAILGLAILNDLDGDDVYLGSVCAQGIGMFGAGYVLDARGDDQWRADCFAQGAAAFGLGVLEDRLGQDSYRLNAWGQGMGGTLGLAVLLDADGNDIYSAGGRYAHRPLLPDDFQSFAQGFGMGHRDRAGGGIGLLIDGGGNDFYNAEVYAQGTSYWYSLGLLLDMAGNDHYQATQYSQGAGIHLSCGFLADLGGNDHYFSRFGPSMGEGHDYSVGILLDKGGNDSYSVSGGMGVALTNSFGMLVDETGNDMYQFSENYGLGSQRSGRGYAGTALFMDLNGNDVYPQDRAANDSLWIRQDYAIGLDRSQAGSTEKLQAQATAEDDTTLTWELTADMDSLWSVAIQWGVGENHSIVPKARKALVRRADEAIVLIRDKNLLNSTSSLVRRTLNTLTKGAPETMRPLLTDALSDTLEDVRLMALGLLGRETFADLSPVIRDRCDTLRGKELRTSLFTLGKMKDNGAITYLSGFLQSDDEKLRLTSTRALAGTESPAALPHLATALDDERFTIRSAALTGLKKYTSRELLRAVPAEASKYEQRLLWKYLLTQEKNWWVRRRLRKRLQRVSE